MMIPGKQKQLKIPTLTWREKIRTNSKIKNIDKKYQKNVEKSQKMDFRNSIQIWNTVCDGL